MKIFSQKSRWVNFEWMETEVMNRYICLTWLEAWTKITCRYGFPNCGQQYEPCSNWCDHSRAESLKTAPPFDPQEKYLQPRVDKGLPLLVSSCPRGEGNDPRTSIPNLARLRFLFRTDDNFRELNTDQKWKISNWIFKFSEKFITFCHRQGHIWRVGG